jgi:hypothetical protein
MSFRFYLGSTFWKITTGRTQSPSLGLRPKGREFESLRARQCLEEFVFNDFRGHPTIRFGTQEN